MELSKKLAALEKIYGIYDKFAASLDLACKKSTFNFIHAST